jgi:hypothetical protein
VLFVFCKDRWAQNKTRKWVVVVVVLLLLAASVLLTRESAHRPITKQALFSLLLLLDLTFNLYLTLTYTHKVHFTLMFIPLLFCPFGQNAWLFVLYCKARAEQSRAEQSRAVLSCAEMLGEGV